MRSLLAALIALLVACALPVDAAPKAGADIVAVARETVARLERQDYAAVHASFNPRLQEAMPEADVRKVWTALVKKRGALKSTGGPVTRPNGKLRAVAIPAQFERGEVEIEVVFNDAGEVSGLLLHKKGGWFR
jgi:hypothetical protein